MISVTTMILFFSVFVFIFILEEVCGMGMSYKLTKNMEIIEQFINSGLECARVCDWTNRDAECCATSLNVSIKRAHRVGVKAISRKGQVFLIRV